jgi:hypothetical protein
LIISQTSLQLITQSMLHQLPLLDYYCITFKQFELFESFGGFANLFMAIQSFLNFMVYFILLLVYKGYFLI